MGTMAPVSSNGSNMRVSKRTLERLDKRGEKNDSYDGILNAVLDELEKLEARNK